MKLGAVIIDDEQYNINNMSLLLGRHCPEVDILSTALNADEGEQIILKLCPDIIFLDVQMPERNGFDLLRSLSSNSFEIIFITAYDQYGIQAIKFSAVDYLLKPVDTEELKLSVQKAAKRVYDKKQNYKLDNLVKILKQEQNKGEHRIALSTLKETRFINPKTIVRCESTNNYTTFFLEGGEKLMVARPIYEYEEILFDYGFIRCHQSHLINLVFIKSWIKTNGGYLLLQDRTEVPVSRIKRDVVKQILERHILIK